MRKSLSFVALMALAAALFPAAFAQEPSSQDQNQPGMSQSQPDQQADQTQPSSYTGTVMKSGGKYVLKTDAGALQLDDQMKAKKYNGKQVTVTGTMDKTSGMLHVTDIAPAMQH
jgi:lipopolysaccharide export system protein LptA